MNRILEKKWGLVLIALVYTSLWGLAYSLVKLCMRELSISDDLDKCLLAGIRFTLSGAALSVYAGVSEKRALPTKNEFPKILGYGLLGTAIQYSFTFIGLSRVASGVGAIFDQICVFLVVLLGGILLKNDSLTVKKVIGCVLGFIGIVAVNIDGLSFSFSFSGEGIMVIAALCQTGAYFIAAMSAGKVGTVRLVGNAQLIGGLSLLCVSLLLGARIPQVSLTGVLLLLALAAISAVSYVLSLLPLRYYPASKVSVFNLLIPVFGVLFSAPVLGENILKWNYPIALVFIALGIFTVNYKNGKDKSKDI